MKRPRKAGAGGPKQGRRPSPDAGPGSPSQVSPYHVFGAADRVAGFRASLLSWYDQAKRDLPWRRRATEEPDPDQRAYAVWVSEIMLQQTQVATVTGYYTRWMQVTPATRAAPLPHVAKMADPERLPRYPRHQGGGPRPTPSSRGAPWPLYTPQTRPPPVTSLSLPRSAEVADAAGLGWGVLGGGEPALGRPGLLFTGPATAGRRPQGDGGAGGPHTPNSRHAPEAAARGGQVHGRGHRLHRLRPGQRAHRPESSGLPPGLRGQEGSRRARSNGHFCARSLAQQLVDPARPGDFNQAAMELGATVCTPRGPLCPECPVRGFCHAQKRVEREQAAASQRLLGSLEPETLDVEECAPRRPGLCPLCLPPSEPWRPDLGVANFPRQPARKAPREQRTALCVLQQPGPETGRFLLVQRPSSGLLAGLWEFPSVPAEGSESDQRQALAKALRAWVGGPLPLRSLRWLGEVVHIFSHIRQTYVVYSLALEAQPPGLPPSGARWVTRAEFQAAAVPTAMKKVLRLFEGQHSGSKKPCKSPQGPATSGPEPGPGRQRKQLTLSAFFKPTSAP